MVITSADSNYVHTAHPIVWANMTRLRRCMSMRNSKCHKAGFLMTPYRKCIEHFKNPFKVTVLNGVINNPFPLPNHCGQPKEYEFVTSTKDFKIYEIREYRDQPADVTGHSLV